MMRSLAGYILWLASVVGGAALIVVIAVVVIPAIDLNGSGNTAKPGMAFHPTSGVGLQILSPLNGQDVSDPFTLQVASAGVTIADPALNIPGAMHYHVLIDKHPFTPSGEIIPEGDGYYHFWGDSVELDLTPSFHSLTVILGDNDHVRPVEAPAQIIGVIVED